RLVPTATPTHIEDETSVSVTAAEMAASFSTASGGSGGGRRRHEPHPLQPPSQPTHGQANGTPKAGGKRKRRDAGTPVAPAAPALDLVDPDAKSFKAQRFKFLRPE
ncbi:hypothetical protein HK405_014784, partial [Cladochytrium tenue]